MWRRLKEGYSEVTDSLKETINANLGLGDDKKAPAQPDAVPTEGIISVTLGRSFVLGNDVDTGLVRKLLYFQWAHRNHPFEGV